MAMVEMVVVVEEDHHPMLDGVKVDNLTPIVTNHFALTVGDIDIHVKIVGISMAGQEMYLQRRRRRNTLMDLMNKS